MATEVAAAVAKPPAGAVVHHAPGHPPQAAGVCAGNPAHCRREAAPGLAHGPRRHRGGHQRPGVSAINHHGSV